MAEDPVREPWWASGSGPDDGLDDSQDPFDAHRDARRGDAIRPDPDTAPPGDGATDAGGDMGRLAADAIDLVGRLAAEVGRRVHARATANASPPPGGAFTRPDGPDLSNASSPPTDGAGWRRLTESIAPHADGEVCDACPVCLGLRALRQARPEVVAHLSDAAHHVSLALRALADAQAGDTGGLEKIDLDP